MGRRIQGPLPTEMQIALVRGCDSTEARLPVKRIATMFLFAWLGSKRSGCSGPDQRSPECVRYAESQVSVIVDTTQEFTHNSPEWCSFRRLLQS